MSCAGFRRSQTNEAMKHTTAIRIAIQAIEKQIQKINFDANLYELDLVVGEQTFLRYQERERLRQAIEILKNDDTSTNS